MSNLERAFGRDAKTMNPAELRAVVGMNPILKQMIRETILGYEQTIAGLKEALDDHQELADRLRLTQLALIVALQKMGGSMDLAVGQMNAIPPGSVVKVEKLERGDGDNVPLRVSWRGPDPSTPATVDFRPGS